MYLIENAEIYLNVLKWADVYSEFARMNAVGMELALCCSRDLDSPVLWLWLESGVFPLEDLASFILYLLRLDIQAFLLVDDSL